jgi:hypothetical protein
MACSLNQFCAARCIATTEAPEIPYWLPSKRAVYASAALLRPVLAFSFDMRTGSELAQPVFPTPSEAAEKIDSKRFQVAQALLPVRVLLPLSSMHSQEWLCYSTFSAAS